jgi:D-alanyl-D-alanine carboxypeptidase (penicillin-binding protein 5/6)
MRSRAIILTIISGIIVGSGIFFVLHNKKKDTSSIPTMLNVVPEQNAQAFLLPISETSYLPIRDFGVPEPILDAKAAALFDVKSGRFIFTKNPEEQLPIASVTKLMTAIVILENLDLNRIIVVPVEDINVDGLGGDLYRDERFRGTDLFKFMLIKSSNDAALTFGDFAKKYSIDLVGKMNEKAKEIGMTNTKFTNPAGLDDQDAFSTASDLVKLVNYAEKFDLINETLRTKSLDITSADGRNLHHLTNTNQLLGEIQGIVVGKTGYTEGAIGTMVLGVALDSRDNQIISVILGSHDRFGETKALINWAKKAYYWK